MAFAGDPVINLIIAVGSWWSTLNKISRASQAMVFISVIRHEFSTLMAKFVLDFVSQFDVPCQIFVGDLNAANRASFFRH